MRGCLGFTLVASVLVTVIAWVAPVPVADLVLGAAISGVLATPATVEVEAEPPPRVLTGHADAVRIRATDAALADGRVRVVGLDVRLDDVGLLARTAARVTGTLDSVTVGADGLVVERATLGGSSETILTSLLLRTAEAQALVRGALASAAIPVTAIGFAQPRSLILTIGGREIPTLLAVTDGALLAIPSGGLPTAVLLSAGATYPLRLTGVEVTSEGVVLDATLPGSTLGL